MLSPKDSAQAELKKLPLHVGDVYTHYKAGGTYEIIALVVKEDTLEPLVIYRAIDHGNTLWARVYSSWNEDIEVDGKVVKRFTKSLLR